MLLLRAVEIRPWARCILPPCFQHLLSPLPSSRTCERSKAVVSWDGGSWGHPTTEQSILSQSCLGVRVTGSELQTGGIALEGQNQPGRCALGHLASVYSCHLGEGGGLDRGFLDCSISLKFSATGGCSPVAKAEGAAGDEHADLAFSRV